ncbi:MAG: NAD(P)H-binding protein [Pseudomonadota bacterium]
MTRRVLVLGGKGFIGRHAVAALRERELEHLAVGTRSKAPSPGPLQEHYLVLHERTKPEDWRELAGDFDVILNCVGILRQVGRSTYNRVHHLAPKAIAKACETSGTTFIHVSALGLADGDRSRFLTSKRRGEQAIRQTKCNWVLVRPSLLDGEGGFGAAWLRGVSKLPVFATPMDAQGQIAALTAADLGEALASLCTAQPEAFSAEASRVYEFGGLQTYSFEGYIRGLRRRYSNRRALAIPIPALLARLGAHLCDLFHFTPFSFGHWELLRKNNVPQPNRLPEVLGRDPEAVIKGRAAGGELNRVRVGN